MTANFDKLLDALKKDSQQVIDEFDRETKVLEDDLRESLLEEAKRKYRHQKDRIEKEAHDLHERQLLAYSSRSKQEVNRYQLQLIEEVIADAKAYLNDLSEEEYIDFLKNQLHLASDIVEIRVPKKRESLVKSENYDVDVVVDDSLVDGFVLVAANKDINFEFNKLIEFYHDDLVEFVRKGLFDD